MPIHSRIDIPGFLQHVMVRGIERSDIFLDDGQEYDPEKVAGLLKALKQERPPR
jgi:hypothetical protein